MRKIQLFILMMCVCLYSCTMEPSKEVIEKWKQEIRSAEQNFAQLAQKEGIRVAFLAYAAENAVLMRNDSLIIGKNALKAYFNDQDSPNRNEQLLWHPEFVAVANSGELGYTYGYYTYKYTDPQGNTNENKGVFHTVWKRQANGDWKFVWD